MVICLDVFILNIFLQIVTRVVFNQPLVFTEEVSRQLFIWMVFLGLPYSTKTNKHISLDIFTKRTPPTVQYILSVFVHVVTLVVFAWVLYQGIIYLDFVGNVRTPVLQIRKAIICSIIPLSAFLMLARTLERMKKEYKEFAATKHGKGCFE